MEHYGRYVTWCRGAPGGALHSSGELVEREIVGTADLQCLAAGGGVDDRLFDDGGSVGDRDEVDWVLASSEHERAPRARGGVVQQIDPQLEERGCSHDRGGDAASG